MRIKEVRTEFEFEGTDTELDAYLRVAPITRNGRQLTATTPDQRIEINGKGSEDGAIPTNPHFTVVPVVSATFVTKEQAKRIITRRPLSPPLTKMLEHLYRAKDKRTASTDIRELIGFGAADPYGADRFRGLMGAFGRRVVHDVGTGVAFWDQEWNHIINEFTWRLPTAVRQAIGELGMFPEQEGQEGGE
jgi:hypothetical protein